MKGLVLKLCLILLPASLAGQLPPGSWADRLPYNISRSVAAGDEAIYSSTGSSILIFDRNYNELKKLSRINGLSSTGISEIGWSDEEDILIIAFNDGNIDLAAEKTIINIPDIHNRNLETRFNRIRTMGKHAYLATVFGIVVLDLEKKEIRDTWKPGPGPADNEVFDVAFGNDMIYAATSLGMWQAGINTQGLSYFGNWELIEDLPGPDERYTQAVFTGETLYCNLSDPSHGDRIFSVREQTTQLPFSPGTVNRSFDVSPEGFIVTSPDKIIIYSEEGSVVKTITSYGWGTPDASRSVHSSGSLWIADLRFGLVRATDQGAFESLTLTGPATTLTVSVVSEAGKTVVCGGDMEPYPDNGTGHLQVSVYENNRFTNIISEDVSAAVRACIDPADNSRFFVSTRNDGLFEYRGTRLVNHYDDTNSPLETGISSGSEAGTCGMAFDRSGNLWVTQSYGGGSIKILKKEGTWIANPLTIVAAGTGDIIISGKGQALVTLPGSQGLFIFDDNGTPEYFNDDRYRKIQVKDSDGRIISSVIAVAEDSEGNIWLGTEQGPVIFRSGADLFDTDIRCYRIKVPRDDGTGTADYLLGTEKITAVEVDGANRKWLGTESSGAYLVSQDGSEIVRNYTMNNSPLFSDSVTAISVDDLSGEVWIGTPDGLISVRETATKGKDDYRNIYAFPNPVREDFNGNVTISGLVENSEIKITDVSGNLVFETRSLGGQAEWDLTTYNSRRVSTGVYLVFCASPDGSLTGMVKILVIGN